MRMQNTAMLEENDLFAHSPDSITYMAFASPAFVCLLWALTVL